MTRFGACVILSPMNDTTPTDGTPTETGDKTRTRNVLSSECKEWVKTFVRKQMTFFFGSERISEEVSAKIIKDVIANVGAFSDYSNTHRITELAAVAGLQKRILRSIGVHVDDSEILAGARVVLDRADDRNESGQG